MLDPACSLTAAWCAQDASGYTRPFLCSATSTAQQPLAGLDAMEGELSLVAWGKDGLLILKQTHAAQESLWRYSLPDGPAEKLAGCPEAAVWGGGFFAEGEELVVHMQDAATPPRFVAVDASTGAVGRTVLSAGDGGGGGGGALPAGRPMVSVELKGGGNGETVQAWLATPEGDGP